jgi:hypothetical protein
MGTPIRIPPNYYIYTPQLLHVHPPLNKLRSFHFKLEYHVCLTCLHLNRENTSRARTKSLQL